MTSTESEIGKSGTPDGWARGLYNAVFFLVCSLVIGFFAWAAEPGYRSLNHPLARDSDYNLLVQGFRAGQLNLKAEPPPELAKAANPYDRASYRAYIADVFDMSYYKGKLYIYFGVTPALTLYWPYWTLTGHYLSDKKAVVVFFAVGFLALAWLLRAIGQRCFPEASIWAVAAGMLAVGLATGLLEMTSYWCDVNEVAPSSGFAFSMLALAAIWRSLNEPKTQFKWLSLASVAFGLAIGARPTWLFGAIILLVPVAQARRAAIDRGSRRRAGWLLAAAIGPVTFIGLGLMLYNFLRFDNPFEFGLNYQLTQYPSNNTSLFGVHFFWFDFRYYFLGWMRWCGHFPFLQLLPSLPVPADAFGAGNSYGGILVLSPLVWLALAVPLAWRTSRGAVVSSLRWFLIVTVSLFAIEMVATCLYFAALSRYALEFLPALLLLSLIGLLAVASMPVWRRVARMVCWLLVAGSIVFNLLAIVAAHAQAECFTGNYLVRQGRPAEAVEYIQNAVALEPGSELFHFALGNALSRSGQREQASAQYLKALQLKPDYAEAQNNLAFTLLQMGQVDEAIGHFKRAVEITPTGEAYYNLGYAFRRKGMGAEGAACFEKAIELQPPFLPAQINLAWMLATWPDPSVRNGTKAVALAEKANDLAVNQDPRILRVVAAAYAESGRFPEAVSAAKQALALAVAQANARLTNALPAEIKLYQAKTPCRSTGDL